MKAIKKLLLTICFFSNNIVLMGDTLHKIDLIAFSFNRPLQLYAFLESVSKYSSGLNHVYVVYRSDEGYKTAYKEVQDFFPQIIFFKQGNNPKKDFKPLVIKCFDVTNSDFIVFGVDDIIIKNYIDFGLCISKMIETNSYAFCLRLGKNIIQNNYGNVVRFPVPPLKNVGDNIFTFRFNKGTHYWNYPNNLDMTIYKKSEIKNAIKDFDYTSPNTLEGRWAQIKEDKCKSGLCFDISKIINTPLNLVQRDWHNPCEHSFSPKNLLDKWNNGLKIDIDYFFGIQNDCPHIKMKPVFTVR